MYVIKYSSTSILKIRLFTQEIEWEASEEITKKNMSCIFHTILLEVEIDAFAKEIEQYAIIKSIPGMGEKMAATIIFESGEIDRFTDPKKLITLVGVESSVLDSGEIQSSH